jgi:Tol biopolymer transport system component
MIRADGKPQLLTNDGIPKGNPLWSENGTKITFERQSDETVALDNLIVMDPVSTTGCNTRMKSALAAFRTEDHA